MDIKPEDMIELPKSFIENYVRFSVFNEGRNGNNHKPENVLQSETDKNLCDLSTEIETEAQQIGHIGGG